MLMTDLLSNEWLGLRFLNPAEKSDKKFPKYVERKGAGVFGLGKFPKNVFWELPSMFAVTVVPW